MKKNRTLPKGVEIKNGKYQYRHYVPVKDRATTTIPHDKKGRAPRVILCPSTAPDSLLYSTLATVQKTYEHQADPEYLTLGWLHRKWQEHVPTGNGSGSRAFKGLAPASQKRYRSCETIFDHKLKINGQWATLKNVRADHLETPTLRKILDKLYLEGTGPSQINNQLAMLGSMYKYANQYRPEIKIERSPTKGIEKFQTGKSNRYVTDQEYQVQYQIAGQVNRPYLQPYMELSYLLAARGCEVSNLKIGAATEQGIIVTRTKGSLNTGIKWTPRLRKAWEAALSHHQTTHPDPHRNIIANIKGHELAKSSIDSAWEIVKNEMKARGLEKIYFTAHALKFKGISDASDRALAGQSEAMQMHYKVNVDWFDAPS